MKYINQNQKGFGLLGVFLVLMVLVGLGLAGWYIQQSQHKQETSPKTTQNQTTAYTDTAKLYTIVHPASWAVKEAAGGHDGPPKDHTQVSKAVNFIPPDTPKGRTGYGVAVQADKTEALATEVRRSWQANNRTPEDKTLNGYPAQYLKTEFRADAEAYIDHAYLLTHNGASVYVTFRENYYHQHPPEDWTASRYLDEFQATAKSVKFLN